MKKQILILVLFLTLGSIKAQIVVPLTLPDNCNVSNDIEFFNNEIKPEISVYPNPNSGVFTINIANNSIIDNVTIEIYNSTGAKCYTKAVYCNSEFLIKNISLTNLTNGVYFIKVYSSEYELNSSFIIQK